MRDFVTWSHSAGWIIFPLHRIVTLDGAQRCTCGDVTCGRIGKHPAWKWKEGNLKSPQALTDVTPYLWPNDADQGGFGVHLGLSRLVVLDIDPRNGGDASAAELFAAHGTPPTFTVRTGSGGWHYYFVAPDWLDSSFSSNIRIAPGVELLSGSHFVVSPHSPHKSGGRYTIERHDIMATLPEWLAEAAVTHKAATVAKVAAVPATFTRHARFDDADIIARRAAAYVAKRPPAVSGKGGQAATITVACDLIRGFSLSIDDAMPIFREWNASCSPPWEDDELRRRLEWAATQSGERGYLLNADRRRPWTLDAEDWEFVHDESKMAALIDVLFGVEKKSTSLGPDAAACFVAEISIAPPTPAATVTKPAPPAQPPASESLSQAYAPPSQCPTPKGVIMRCDADFRNRVMWIDCRRLNCPHCHMQKREQYHATIRHHLSEHAENLPRADVFSFVVTGETAWKSVSRSLRRRFADYFRLAFPDGTCIVVATEMPPRSESVTDVNAMSPADAADRLCDAVSNLAELRPKIFTFTRPWKLIGEIPRRTDRRWRRVARVGVDQRTVFDILEHHRVDYKPVSRRGAFWGWTAWEWSDRQCHHTRPGSVVSDIRDGEVAPPDMTDEIFGRGAEHWRPGSHSGPPHAGADSPAEFSLDW